MYPLRTSTVKGASTGASLVGLLATSRVLKAYPIEPADEVAYPRWVLPVLGLLIVLVTAALGLHAWLQSLVLAPHDEAALATFLAVLVTASWVSAVGLVSAIALLAVLWASRSRPRDR